jgi:pachytene checkpoint protein 2
MSTFSHRYPVHVEIEIKDSCALKRDDLVAVVKDRLSSSCPVFENGPLFLGSGLSDDIAQYISSASISDMECDRAVSFWQAELLVHAYRLSDQEPEKDFIEGEEELPAAEQWELPNRMLAGLWESIIVESSIKQRLLGYCTTSLHFSTARVDPTIISWNRMILLHGPPGNALFCRRYTPPHN